MVADITDLEIEVKIESERSIDGTIYYAGPKGPKGDNGDDATIGSVIMFAGSTIPDNWLICNGQEISRSLYSDLFNVIGTMYGAGDGTTTFNVPELLNEFTQDQKVKYIIKSL